MLRMHGTCKVISWGSRAPSVRQDSSPGIQQGIPEVLLQPGACVGAGTAGAVPIPVVICMAVMLQQKAAVKQRIRHPSLQSQGPLASKWGHASNPSISTAAALTFTSKVCMLSRNTLLIVSYRNLESQRAGTFCSDLLSPLLCCYLVYSRLHHGVYEALA